MNIVPRRFFLDDLFNDFDEGSIKPVNMKCDIYEKEGNYFIEMDLPGYDKKDIDIDFDIIYLTITASKEEDVNDEGKNYIRRERNFGSYKRQFYLGDINEDEIKAEFNNGILKVVVPKKEIIDTKKKIEIG